MKHFSDLNESELIKLYNLAYDLTVYPTCMEQIYIHISKSINIRCHCTMPRKFCQNEYIINKVKKLFKYSEKPNVNISNDDIINLQIDLETTKSVDEFLEKV